jgi:hypothetical protein
MMKFPPLLDDANKRLALLALFFILLAVVVSVLYYYYSRSTTTSRSSTRSWLDDLKSSKSSASNKDAGPLKDIWQERKRNGMATSSSSSTRRSEKGDRPFGSSYYYAHNNPNAKGGYTDGLRMEDYTMNGPRLLSKSGVPVITNESNDTANNSQEEPPDETAVHEKPLQSKMTVSRENIRQISKYLWDDPGDPNGIATIQIQSLPAASDGSPVAWKKINEKIVNIDAQLVNNKKGLLVMLETGDGDKYKLYIATLYGDVDAVRTLVKPKRLLVRLYKKKNRINIWDKSNLKEWPHPYADREKQA